jgi:hypothetical protein
VILEIKYQGVVDLVAGPTVNVPCQEPPVENDKTDSYKKRNI